MSEDHNRQLSQIQNYKQQCEKIIGRSKIHSQSRLSSNQIRQITKAFMKDKKMHENNMGVIHQVKGKTYCLQLGQIQNSKDFPFYFYTNRYKREVKEKKMI